MKRLLSSLAILAFVCTTHAEILEANVTVQIKLYAQQPETPSESGDVNSTYKVTTFKNKDLIKLIGADLDVPFTPKARLIQLTTVTPQSRTEEYIVRDKGVDYFVREDTFDIIHSRHLTSPGAAAVGKVKVSGKTQLGFENSFGPGELVIAPNGEDGILKLTGSVYQNVHLQNSKEFGTSFKLRIHTYNITGMGSHNLSRDSSNNQVSQGNFKISLPKILPIPRD